MDKTLLDVLDIKSGSELNNFYLHINGKKTSLTYQYVSLQILCLSAWQHHHCHPATSHASLTLYSRKKKKVLKEDWLKQVYSKTSTLTYSHTSVLQEKKIDDSHILLISNKSVLIKLEEYCTWFLRRIIFARTKISRPENKDERS